MATYYSNTSVVYRLKCVVTESNINVTNNTSQVTINLYIQHIGDAAYSINQQSGQPFYLNIDGQRVASATKNYSLSAGAQAHVISHTRTITHNSDGTKAITVSFNTPAAGLGGGYSPGALSGSGQFTLTKINRLSTGSQDKSRASVGDRLTITVNKSTSNYTTTIWTDWYTEPYHRVLFDKSPASEFSFDIPEWMAEPVEGRSGWGKFVISTYDGNTKIGDYWLPRFDLDIPDDPQYKPDVSFTITEANEDVASKVGTYVQNLSRLRIQASGTPKMNARIRQYDVILDGDTFYGADIVSNPVSKSGSFKVTVKATDTRGFIGTAEKTINVISYSAPTLTASAYRSDAAGNAYEDGDRCKVNFTGSYSPVTVSGTNKNSMTIKVERSTDGGSNFTQIHSATASGSTITAANSFPVGSAAIIRVSVSDQLGGSTSQMFNIGPSFKLFDCGAGGRSIAFGSASGNAGRFEVNMPAEFPQGHTGRNCGLASREAGWVKCLEILLKGAWCYGPITIKFSELQIGSTTVILGLKGAATPEATTIYRCTQSNNQLQIRVVKDGATISFWVYKPAGGHTVGIDDIQHHIGNWSSYYSLSYTNVFSATEPGGIVPAHELTNSNYIITKQYSYEWLTPTTAKPWKNPEEWFVPYDKPAGYKFLCWGGYWFYGLNGSAFFEVMPGEDRIGFWIETATGMLSGFDNRIVFNVVFIRE